MENNTDISSFKERFLISSNNNSRNFFIISKTFLKPYHKHMKIQNNNLLWYDQVENEYILYSLNFNIKETNIFNSSVSNNNSKGK